MHEAIVSHDEYYAANDALRKVRTHTRVRSDQRDRVYYCGYCGRRLRKTFGTDEYYSCATPLYVKGALCTDLRWSRSAIEEVVFSTYKRQIHIVSEQWHEEKKKNQSQLPDLKTKHKSLSIQIKSLSREVASLYEQYRTGKLTREEFLEKKQLFSTEKEKLQAEISSVEENINTESHKERAESASLQTLLDIASLAQEDDETLKSRMYDDIEKVIVFDNHTIDIRWKFDVDFKDNHT